LNKKLVSKAVTNSPFSLRDACMDAGSRAPTVGALGDAGAIAEKVRMRGFK
jgi:hypothetical protein